MTPTDEAAQLIAAARNSRTTIPRLPEHLRPRTPQDAVAIQLAVTRQIDKPIFAWKCSLPKPDRIPFAPIFDLYPEGDVPVVPAAGGKKIIEPEIAFTLKRDLPPRPDPFTESEIRAAIGDARLVIEIIGSRFADFMQTDFPEKIADHILNESLVTGPAFSEPFDGLTALPITVEGGGETQRFEGRHPENGPFGCLAWMVNYLRSEGWGLRAGQIVTTGSFAGFVYAPVHVPLTVTFGNLGAVHLTLKA